MTRAVKPTLNPVRRRAPCRDFRDVPGVKASDMEGGYNITPAAALVVPEHQLFEQSFPLTRRSVERPRLRPAAVSFDVQSNS